MPKKERLPRRDGKKWYNRHGIPIDAYMSLALLQVMGVDDPFEGRRYDPQFEGVGESGRINREPPACPVAAKTRGGV